MVEADIQPAIIKMYVRSIMRYSATILITPLLAVPAMSVELFQYRGAAKGWRHQLER